MPFSGSGTWTNVYNWVNDAAAGIKILASRQQTQWDDIASNGLSNVICKDGQTTTTARIPFSVGIRTTSVLATADDSGALGASGTAFSDLFLASGGVINWNAGNATLTHSASNLSMNTNFDQTLSFAGDLTSKLINSSSSVSSRTYYMPNNGTNFGIFQHTGMSYTPSTIYRTDATLALGAGTGGITVGTTTAQPIYFAINNAEIARFDANGNIKVGTTTAIDRNFIVKNAAVGSQIFSVSNASQGTFFNGTDNGAYSVTNAAFWVPYVGATSRSINAGGTINASGADYAEYMYKSDNCGAIIKGAIVGVDVDGKLTDKLSASHSFVIKSTNPSYVGGDVWGTETVLGEHPKINGKLENETDQDYETRITTFDAALEVERQKVDRIAFSGQVPVNVIGATVGDYIIPVAGPDGGIAGEAVTNPTFDQYRTAVGRVWKILEDGRAFVSVKVA